MQMQSENLKANDIGALQRLTRREAACMNIPDARPRCIQNFLPYSYVRVQLFRLYCTSATTAYLSSRVLDECLGTHCSQKQPSRELPNRHTSHGQWTEWPSLR